MPPTDDRTIGRLEAQVADLREDMRHLREDVQELKDLLHQARGARWILTVLAMGFGGTGGVVAAWLSGVVRHSSSG